MIAGKAVPGKLIMPLKKVSASAPTGIYLVLKGASLCYNRFVVCRDTVLCCGSGTQRS